MQHLDPHQRPPEGIRTVYKKYQKIASGDLERDLDIVDLIENPGTALSNKLHVVRRIKAEDVAQAFGTFAGGNSGGEFQHQASPASTAVYEHDDMPGLHIIPSLLPPDIQLALLSRLLHRDLSNSSHLTNIHTHYNISYPPTNMSFFSLSPSSQTTVAVPLDPAIHKPLSVAQLLNRKLRWTTLGGQYDWTAKQYPKTIPPAFPSDIKDLLASIFPTTCAEAAIVNLYSAGDTLSVHRDVAETSTHGLISLSLGCDAIFVIGTDHNKSLTLRLRSGSAVYMSGASRFAWHGVPQIVAGSCPEYLRDWPGVENGAFDQWKGWMAGKRVNLNVRQMWD